MEHYVAYLVTEGENTLEGLHLMTVKAYQEHIAQEPGFRHDNWGDFYSPVPVQNLADKVKDAIEENIKYLVQKGICDDDAQVQIVDEFPKVVNSEKDYLIKHKEGIQVYASTLASHPIDSPSWTYGVLSCLFVEELFSPEKQGSFQKSVQDLERLWDKDFRVSRPVKEEPIERE